MSVEPKPRLGDRADLVIEIQRSAVQSYRQTRESSTGVTLTDDEASEELRQVLLASSVTFSSGSSMSVRGRVRSLEVDVASDLVRVSPTLVRCHLAQVRRLQTDTVATGSRASDAIYATRKLRVDGRTWGFFRVLREGGPIEYREVAKEDGGEPPEWGPAPPLVRRLAAEDKGLAAWLAKHGGGS